MGSDARSGLHPYVGQLANHARRLQRDAQGAIAQGDYARAAALIDDAELLADDVSGLVDAIEERQSDAMMRLASDPEVVSPAGTGSRKRLALLPPRRIRAALGTSVVLSLALVEC
jgi:hypothetical protein